MKPDDIFKKPRRAFVRSAETKKLVDHLQGLEVNAIVEYAELSRLIREDVQKEAGHLLRRARDILRSEFKMEFDTIINVGLRRCDDDGVMGHLHKTVRAMRKKAKRGMAISACIKDWKELPQSQRAEYLAKQSYFGMIHKSSSDKRQKKIEEYTKHSTEMLDLKKMLIALSE